MVATSSWIGIGAIIAWKECDAAKPNNNQVAFCIVVFLTSGLKQGMHSDVRVASLDNL